LIEFKVEINGSNSYKNKLFLSTELYKKWNKNLNIAWIANRKAFESVPHSWVEKSIEIVGADSKIVNYQCVNGTESFI
jgi:hypothetical protein